MFYERPWMGGKWGLRDAIEYMLTADMALLTEAATRRADYLLKSYQMARQAIAAGARGQAVRLRHRGEAMGLAHRVGLSGAAVAGGHRGAAGARGVSRAWQTVRRGHPGDSRGATVPPYLIDLLEPQHYPNLKEKPYDITGWTLPMQMGVSVDRIDEHFDAELDPVNEFRAHGSVAGKGAVLLLDHRENDAFLATSFFMDREGAVRWTADGTIVVDSAYTENGGARGKLRAAVQRQRDAGRYRAHARLRIAAAARGTLSAMDRQLRRRAGPSGCWTAITCPIRCCTTRISARANCARGSTA